MNASRQAGVSLLEVLVALLVLSIGVLGVVALQTKSMALVQEAYWRGQAVALAYDLGDRLRANPDQIASYAIGMDAGAPEGGSLAKRDLAGWLDDLDTALPNGDGSVVIKNEQVTITVQWNTSPRLNGNLQSFVTEVYP
ncbi:MULTISPECIES: type IV pilus modification protein PilV [Modicisalibacter]|uniref:type IV pilus modification protein PilV n=1 Tax=Modicisalibacter TaxID=574347 RepID=UPI00100B02F2|nr:MULTISPECIES: type IV pilus modification protein PilV [Halomonadaceae]MBZ9558944.1 type IV pilus modification protein PilV [Modicisalibacter sp. R2A 31.J]MBZ9575164.1 type IV pilus modification protein PilV [Modicisalibacter sp. MOD 31.J]